MDDRLTALVAILAIAMLVAVAARRLRLPYTVGLVLVGAMLALSRVAPPIALTHDFIFFGILPPLLFEASLAIRWETLRKDLFPIAVLSTLGTAVSALVTTAGMMTLLRWPFAPSLLFGVLIAATDPVAVIALFRDHGVPGRLRLLVESESLFNDGVAAVLFALALSVTAAGTDAFPGARTVFVLLCKVAGGGILVGLSVAALATLLAGRVSDRLIETALTVVAAYGSFALAESLDVSGVLATVAAGLLMGNLGVMREGQGALSDEARRFVVDFWDFAAFLANSLIFPLIGVSVASMTFDRSDLILLPVVIAVVLASRALTVYPISLLFAASRWAIVRREQHVLFWGGLRGALALALALTLPPTMPYRDAILVAAFSVAAFSIVVQGLTMPALLRWLRIEHTPPPA